MCPKFAGIQVSSMGRIPRMSKNVSEKTWAVSASSLVWMAWSGFYKLLLMVNVPKIFFTNCKYVLFRGHSYNTWHYLGGGTGYCHQMSHGRGLYLNLHLSLFYGKILVSEQIIKPEILKKTIHQISCSFFFSLSSFYKSWICHITGRGWQGKISPIVTWRGSKVKKVSWLIKFSPGRTCQELFGVSWRILRWRCEMRSISQANL